MGKKTIQYIALIAGVFLFISTAHAKQNACLVCHRTLPQETVECVTDCWLRSLHKQNDVNCVACHGGDADIAIGNVKQLSPQDFNAKKSLAMSKAKGFIGIPKGKVMFDVCGKCHSDAVNMYQNSIMGVAYLDNKGGPSCTDCHSAHYVIIPDVPKTCEKCHKDTTGFDQIDPMNVNDATVTQLSKLKIKLAEEKVQGKEMPLFPKELGSFQIGFVAFGVIIILFIIAFIIYLFIEKRR